MEGRRLLIVNADDFGLSEGVNRAIFEAHRRGMLTSTTVMANMPAFQAAAQLSVENPTLAVGVHLNLSTGMPVLPPSQVPTLVNQEGRLLRLDRVLRGLTLGRLDAHQLEAEMSAQVETALDAGIVPSHLDSHHHVHTHPALQPIAVRIAVRFGIRGIRCPVELGLGGVVRNAGMLVGMGGSTKPPLESPRAAYLKTVMLGLLGTLLRARARRAGLVMPEHFRGLLLGLAFTPGELHRELSHLPSGSTEMMTHPGYPDEQLERWTSYTAGRDRELVALLDPASRAILNREGVQLGSYRDL